MMRLYGRRKTRPLNQSQTELFDQLLPNIDVDIQEIVAAPHVTLEIGFGSGEHLIHMAQQNPNHLYVGCEPFINGVASLLTQMDDLNVKNIRIHHADVRTLYSELPDHSIDTVYLLYPDPWPKKRHWKRRFIQPATFLDMHHLLKPQGEWIIATDHPIYQQWIAECLDTPAVKELFTSLPDADLQIQTRYAQKAVVANRTSHIYRLQKK